MIEIFNGYALTSGVVRRRDLSYAIGTEEATAESPRPRSRVFVYASGQWLPPVDLDWNARSCTICHAPDERFIAISEQGYVVVIGGGQVVVEPRVAPGYEMPGPLTEVRGIAGPAYAVGTLRQAYVREGPGRWRRIDQTCRASGPDAADFAFRDIDGYSPTDIYAAGWEGEVWHFDGKVWKSCETPTNLALHSICCAGDGRVYAVGQRGIILRGRGDRWEAIRHEASEHDLWGCEWFQDRLFVAAMSLLCELRGDRLTPVDFGKLPPLVTCYHLSAADGIMWSIGARDILQLDQNGWSRIR